MADNTEDFRTDRKGSGDPITSMPHVTQANWDDAAGNASTSERERRGLGTDRAWWIVVVVTVIALVALAYFYARVQQNKAAAAVEAAKLEAAQRDEAAKAALAEAEATKAQAQADAAQAQAAAVLAELAAEQAKEEAQNKEVAAAEEVSKAFESQVSTWRSQLCPNCFEVQIQNHCDEKVRVVTDFKFGPAQNDWAASGWWDIGPNQTKAIGVVSANSVFYFYVESSTHHWDGTGKDESITTQIVSNNFFRKEGDSLLGRDKRSVSMFKKQFDSRLGTVSLTCNSQ